MRTDTHLRKRRSAGYLLVLVLVFGSVFFTIVSSFIGFLVTQSQVINQRVAITQARDIAEAGLNYYKWYLAHYPDDPAGVDSVRTFTDSELGDIGAFELSFASSTFCGEISDLTVQATGYTFADPSIRRTISAQYERPSIAEYSFITNSGVYFGGGTIIGPVHSNQGIRIEASHNAVVQSNFSSWTCDSSYECTPSQTVPGVYTTSGNATPGLFAYPVDLIDYDGRIALALPQFRDRALNHGGIHLTPAPGGDFGYRLTFNSNNTVTVHRVTNTLDYWSYSSEDDWQRGERNAITGISAPTILPINPDCPVIFVEDKTWIQGDIASKVTLVAADLNTAEQERIVIQGDVVNVNATSSGLIAIAEGNIDIGINVEEDIDLQGIFISQNGRFGRNLYIWQNWMFNTRDYGWQAVRLPWSLRNPDNFAIRGDLNILGTITSRTRAVTTWNSTGGVFLGGFTGGSTSYDRNLVDYPPPFVPSVSDVFEFNTWREEGNL